MEPERRLWLEVLRRATDDARGRQLVEGDDRAGVRRAVLVWVGSRDFHEACHLAGVEPARVEAALRR